MNLPNALTTAELFGGYSETRGSAPAILVPGRKPLNYERLHAHIVETVRALNDMGIGRNHRLGIVAPSGAEAGVMSEVAQSAMPHITLNPAHSLPEFVTLMRRLKLAVIVIVDGLDTAAWQAACLLMPRWP